MNVNLPVMKKLFLLLFLGICACAYAEISTQEIQLNEALCPARPVRPRNELPTQGHTQSQVNYDKLSVEVGFNYYMGDLTVTITDPSGAIVYRTTVDSDATASLRVPIPQSGDYRIAIAGEEYLAEGAFVVE